MQSCLPTQCGRYQFLAIDPMEESMQCILFLLETIRRLHRSIEYKFAKGSKRSTCSSCRHRRPVSHVHVRCRHAHKIVQTMRRLLMLIHSFFAFAALGAYIIRWRARAHLSFKRVHIATATRPLRFFFLPPPLSPTLDSPKRSTQIVYSHDL